MQFKIMFKGLFAWDLISTLMWMKYDTWRVAISFPSA